MEDFKINKPLYEIPKNNSSVPFDWLTPVWAILYLLFLFILFCKGVMSVTL